MPPVQQVWDFPGLPADIFFDHPKSSFTSSPSESPSIAPDDYLLKRTPENVENVDKTLAARSNSKTYIPGKGTVDPHSINMQGLLALFALLGAAFVFGGIWFFFWARNGGFVWRKGDWDEYKSTVLRRKGPDGRTLSNATKSTKLGGGSVVGKGYSDYDGDGYGDGYTESGTGTGVGYADTATNLTQKNKEKERKKEEKKNKPSWKEIAKRRFLRRRADEHSWNGEEYEDDDVRAYRQEKSARVGGINREADGTYHGSDYDTSAPPTHYNQSEMSEARDYAYQSPPPQETRNSRHQSKRQNKRESRNFSFTPGPDEALSSVAPPPRDTNNTRPRRSQSQHQPQTHTQEASARRHNRRRERRRNAPPSSSSSSSTRPHDRRRERFLPPDYSSAGTYSDLYSNAYTNSNSNSNSISNMYSEDESGTRSYHHPIPGLSKGYRRDGGRRRRRDSLSDSD